MNSSAVHDTYASKSLSFLGAMQIEKFHSLNDIEGDKAELVIDTLASWQSPNSESIEWSQVNDAIQTLISEHCADWRLIHLQAVSGLAAPNLVDEETVLTSLASARALMHEDAWQASFPKRHRERFAEQALLTLAKWIDKETTPKPDTLFDAIEALREQCAPRPINWPDAFDALEAAQKADSSEEQTDNPAAPAIHAAHATSTPTPNGRGQGWGEGLPQDTAALLSRRKASDPGEDEVALRDRKRALSNIFAHCKARAPLALETLCLSRMALWHDILTLPPADSDGKTQLLPPSADARAEYQSGLELDSNAMTLLWAALEKTLSTAPFWLDGQILAAQYASRLGNRPAAALIRALTAEVADRLDGLGDIHFKDGTPMLSQPVATVGVGEGQNGGAIGTVVDDFMALPDDIEELEPVERIGAIEELLAQQAKGSRDQALLMLHQAQAHLALGQNFAAEALRTAARESFPTEHILTWEPQLYALLHTRQTPTGTNK